MVCDGFVEGQPFDGCPRQLLRRQVARLADKGWHLCAGIEPGFFLLKRVDGRWQPADQSDRLAMPAYDLMSLPRQREFLQGLQQALEDCGLDVAQMDHEYARGQFEVNFGADEMLASADHVMLFKQAAHALAEGCALVFSMMLRPFADQPGSGMHFRVSLRSGITLDRHGNSRNLFVPHRVDGSVDPAAWLSPIGRQFIAGVLAHSAALCAIAAPTVNSYKRQVQDPTAADAGWTATCVAQGPANRTAMIRTLHGRFEWRLPDGSANPYLVGTAGTAGTARTAGTAQWGMTSDQTHDLNRAAMKAEATEDAMESQGLKLLKISGYMDPTYLYNQRQNRAGFQFLNPVAQDGYNYDNSYFGTVSLDFQKEMEDGTKWRLTLIPNRGAGSVIGEGSIVHEASVAIPLGDLQTRIIAGQFPDWSGYEYLQPTLNKLITHNLLVDFTLPTAYTGAAMEYTRGKWLMKWTLNNLNTSKRPSGETAPAFAYRVDYAKGEFNGFGFAGVHGKAANFRPYDANGNVLSNLNGDPLSTAVTRVDLFEIDGYFIRGDWTVQGQLSYGQQHRSAISLDGNGDLQDARWHGASALAAYKFMPRLEVIGRVDYLNPPGG